MRRLYDDEVMMGEMRYILVAGGAGFIGSHLVDRLMADSQNVVYCMDNFYTSGGKKIWKWMGHPRFELVLHDAAEPFPDREIVFDQIYNLACPASPVWYQYNPIYTIRTCAYGAYELLRLAAECGATYLQASTSEVYGEPAVHPQMESYRGCVNPVGVRSCYDEGKRCAETVCYEYSRRGEADVKIARIFNTYGPRMDVYDGRIISNFVTQALRGKPLTVYGDGTQTRSLCYVDDLVEGLMSLMSMPMEFTGPCNLGNPDEHTALELAELVRELAESDSPIVYKPLPPDDPTHRCPDISLAREKLGWQPSTTIREGLEETIRFYRRELCL